MQLDDFQDLSFITVEFERVDQKLGFGFLETVREGGTSGE